MKIVAFDLFNTIFDISKLPIEELEYYAEVIKLPKWEPLTFSDCWYELPLKDGAKEGIDILSSNPNFMAITLSNAPIELQAKLSKKYNLYWNLIFPLEMFKIYKPNKLAYQSVYKTLKCKPEDMIMVSANKHFGDIEASRSLGSKAYLIGKDKDCDFSNVERLAIDLTKNII